MAPLSENLTHFDEPADYLPAAPTDTRELLAEAGISAQAIREILPFATSSDASGPFWKIE